MDESEDNMSSDDIRKVESPSTGKPKPKKRSLVERELETNLTARVTSPVTNGDGTSLSRYGRARRLKNELESTDPKKLALEVPKTPYTEKSPSKALSPVYKMHASNSPCKSESQKSAIPEEIKLESQIESIYQENKSLSRFGSEDIITSSPAKKFPKVYIRKDLIQRREPEESIMLIKHIFSPVKSGCSKKANSHLNNMEQSPETDLDSNKPQNGYIDNSSVVKALDFDGNKKKKNENKDLKNVLSKNELFELEAKCPYQIGDLAWARMGTYPFWPCIITRDPITGLFLKKKMFGRVEHDLLHVTFFGDNGRRSWIVDNMLRKFLGQLEFETTREAFTPEDKKKDPKLYAAFFISEKRLPFWNISVEEAETLLREPKRLRIDILNEMLGKTVKTPKQLKSGKVTRTDSDVSLSESLYDSLFSEDDGKVEEADRSRNKSKNKSLDVSQVVTACLDNMAAKTGITMIQRQSHMDRWLQKAKSKTPEKTHKNSGSQKDNKSSGKKKKKTSTKDPVKNAGSLSNSLNESNTNLLSFQNEHDYSKYQNEENNSAVTNEIDVTIDDSDRYDSSMSYDTGSGIGIIAKVESLYGQNEDENEQNSRNQLVTTVVNDDLTLPEKESEETENPTPKINDDKQDSSHEMEVDSNKSINTKANELNNENVELNVDNVGTNSNNVLQIETINDQDTIADDVDSKQPTDQDNGDSVLENVPNLNHKTEIVNKHVGDKDVLSVCDRLNKDVITIEDTILDRKEADIHTAGPNDMSIDDSHDNISKVVLSPLANDTVQEVDHTIDENMSERENSSHSEEDCKINEYNRLQEAKARATTIVVGKGDMNVNESSDPEATQDYEQMNENEYADDLDYESDESSYKLEYSPLTNDEKSDNDDDDTSKIIKSHYEPKSNVTEVHNEPTKINEIPESPTKISDTTEIQDKTPNENLSDVIKENGIHNDAETENEINEETASVTSEDSQPKTRSRVRNEMFLGKSKAEKRKLDPEFQKYVELHQDTVMDDYPELSKEEIDSYLFKTWLYEESKKSDVKKADDIHQSGIVKGLEKEPSKKVSLSLKKNSKKKSDTSFIDDTDTASINSEDSETSLVLRRTRFRRIKSPLEVSNDNRSVDPSPDSKSKDDLDTVSINSDASELSHEQKSYKRIKTPFEAAQGKKVAEIRLENIANHCEFELASLNSEDDEPLAKRINTTVKPPFIVDQENKHDEGTKIDADATCLPSKDISNREVNDLKENTDLTETESIDSEDSEVPLSRRKLRRKPKENGFREKSPKTKLKDDFESETASINSENSDVSLNKRKHRAKNDKKLEAVLEDPEFVQYLELRQDSLIDEHPQLAQNEIVNYLYKTWLYEVNSIHELKKTDDIEQSGLVKGLNQEVQPKKVKKRVKGEKGTLDDFIIKEKPKRKIIQPYYNEDLSDMDIEDDIKVFEIFKNKSKVPKPVQSSSSEVNDGNEIKDDVIKETADVETQETKEEEFDEVELYFEELTKPKPNVFKGLVREKVCEICEIPGNLVKCKSCNSMFHVNCVKNKVEVVDVPAPLRGRKKKKKPGRKAKSLEDSESQSDDKSRDLSEENNESIEELPETCTVDAESFETQLEAKMKEILGDINTVHYDSYSSDDGLDWTDTVPGKCEIVDVKPKRKPDLSEYSDFKCNNCTKYDTPVCFVCKSAVSKSSVELRQRCHVAHCHKYYHLECLDQWPQTQFNGGEPSKNNKKINEFFEALSCPRHVCHTCVSDDPRGCKTRFSGDKLARCVKCPATYHAFTKCLPAGSQILTGSHIICPRHYEHRPGKVPCHVNTGWCFICALGGTLICCEYCPTSFHAECLNIKPPEGGYMCEDCETGRLPLYGEMVWVKLGHYRWWPGIILHPCEIPDNIMAVKHSPGEFVVRFFGQYDHYWVNRGRVFPFQEGDSGRISSQKSKIDAAFTTAMEHAQRACEILKCAQPNPEECLDIASSLLPPHYVKLRANRPCGVVARRPDDPEGSLTQCECSARDEDPCGPYSHCLNRMLLTECGPTCRAGERCNNRAFEKRLYPKLAPYRTPHRGWGLKTLEPIKAGQFVIEYVGELIDEEEFRRRMNRKHEIRDENFYFLTLDKERMIDAGPKGNLARFMNHCCEPNCETQKWTVLGDVRVGLFALKDIPANSEVTFNYNLECAGIEKKRCLCGASRCSGYIGAKPKQEESQSKKVKPAKRAYKKRKQEESPSTKTKPTKRLGRPPKPRELTEIEKDLLIIRNATNGISSDDARLSSTDSEHPKTLKRKRSLSQDETSEDTSAKKSKCDTELISL